MIEYRVLEWSPTITLVMQEQLVLGWIQQQDGLASYRPTYQSAQVLHAASLSELKRIIESR